MSDYYEKRVDDPRKEILTIKIIHRIFRVGFAFIFGYAGITGLVNPTKYIQWIPQVILENKIFPLEPIVLLYVFSASEILLTIWFLSGKNSKWAALVAILMLTGINMVNLNQMDILFRNVGLITAGLAFYFFDNFFMKRVKEREGNFWT